MNLLDSLPARPLTLDEGEELANSETVAPLTVLTADAENYNQGVYTLFATASDPKRAFVLGFDPAERRWVVVDSWQEADWTPQRQEAALSTFLDEYYEDLDQEQTGTQRDR